MSFWWEVQSAGFMVLGIIWLVWVWIFFDVELSSGWDVIDRGLRVFILWWLPALVKLHTKSWDELRRSTILYIGGFNAILFLFRDLFEVRLYHLEGTLMKGSEATSFRFYKAGWNRVIRWIIGIRTGFDQSKSSNVFSLEDDRMTLPWATALSLFISGIRLDWVLVHAMERAISDETLYRETHELLLLVWGTNIRLYHLDATLMKCLVALGELD